MILQKQISRQSAQFLLLLFCLFQVAQSTHSNVESFGVLERKIASYSKLIKFDPQSIQTNCSAVEQKYLEYQEAAEFSQEVPQNLVDNALENLFELHTLSKDLTTKIEKSSKLSQSQQMLLELKAERKARQIQLEGKMKEQISNLVETGSIIASGKTEILEVKTKFVTAAKEYKQLVLEIKIFDQKIEQSKEEADELEMEIKEVQSTESAIQEMISHYNKQLVEYEKIKSKSNEVDQIKTLKAQEIEFKNDLAQITKQLEQLKQKKTDINAQLQQKKTETKEWQTKKNEIKQTLKKKGIEFKTLKVQARKVLGKSVGGVPLAMKKFKSTVVRKMKTVEKKEISNVNWDVSVKHLERKKIVTKRPVKLYTDQYYVLQENLKEEIVRLEIIQKTIETIQIEISKFNKFLANNENKELEGQIRASRQPYADQLSEVQKIKVTIEELQKSLVIKMDIEKGKCVDAGKIYSGDKILPFEAIDSNKLTGKFSKLYYLLQMRLNQLNRRLNTINKKLKTSTKSYQKKIFFAEKELRQKEKISVQMEMRAEEEKTNGMQTQLNDATRYSIKYYQLEKTYNAVILQISVTVTKLTNLAEKIQMEKAKLAKTSGQAKNIISKTLKNYQKEKRKLSFEKRQLLALQQSYSKQMLEEKQKGGTKTATLQNIKGTIVSVSTIEKYKALLKRYYEIVVKIKEIFEILEELRNKIDENYETLSTQNGYTSLVQQLLAQLAQFNTQVDHSELEQIVLRREQEEILKALQELLEGIEKEKEFKYKSKLPKKKEQGFGFKISSVSTIPSKIKRVPVLEVKKPQSKAKPIVKRKPHVAKKKIPDVTNKEVKKYLKKPIAKPVKKQKSLPQKPAKKQKQKPISQKPKKKSQPKKKTQKRDQDEEWEWYWEEYIDAKGKKQYRKKYRKQPTKKARIGLGDEEYNYDTDDFYNSGDYVGVHEKIVKVPIAKNAEELSYGYADASARTYYKNIGSFKVDILPFPLTTVESSLKFPKTSAYSTQRLPDSTAESTYKLPKSSAYTNYPLPKSTAESTINFPWSSAETTYGLPTSTAASSIKLPGSSAASTIKLPDSTATSDRQLPSSTAESSIRLPGSIATTTLPMADSSASTSINLPDSTSKSSVKLPDSSGESDLYFPITSAKSTKSLPKSSVKSTKKFPKITVKSTLKKGKETEKEVPAQKEVQITDTTSRSTLSIPRATAESTQKLGSVSSESSLKLPKTTAETSQKIPQSSAQSTKKLGKTIAESTIKIPKTTSESTKKLPKATAESTKKLGKTIAESTIKIPKTTSESTKKIPKASVESTKKLGQTSVESTIKIPTTSSESTKKIPKSTAYSTKKKGEASVESTLDIPKTSSKSTEKIPKTSTKTTIKLGKASVRSTIKNDDKPKPTKPKKPKKHYEFKPLKLNFKYDTSVYSALGVPEASLKSTIQFPDVATHSDYPKPKLSIDTNKYTDSSLKQSIKSHLKASVKSSNENPLTSTKQNNMIPDAQLKSTINTPDSSMKTSSDVLKTSIKTSTVKPDASAKYSQKLVKKHGTASAKSSNHGPLTSVKQNNDHPDSSLKSSLNSPDTSMKTNSDVLKTTIKTSTVKPDASTKSSSQKSVNKHGVASTKSSHNGPLTSIKQNNAHPDSSLKSSLNKPDTSIKTNSDVLKTSIKTSTVKPDVSTKSSSQKSVNKHGVASTKSSHNEPLTSIKQNNAHPDSSLKSSLNAPDTSMKTGSDATKATIRTSTAKPDASAKSSVDNPTVSKKSTHSLPVSSVKSNRKMTSTLRSSLGKAKSSVKSDNSNVKSSEKTNIKSFLQSQVALQLKSLRKTKNFPSQQKSQGRLKIKSSDEIYSEKYYDLLSDSEMLLTKYEILIKRLFELKISIFLYSQKLKKSIFSTEEVETIKAQLIVMEKELKGRQIQEVNQRKMIELVIKAMEAEKLRSIEKFIRRKLSQTLHKLMEQFANLKAQYALIIIRMKIITESKHSITLRIRTLFQEIATNKLQTVELKIRYYELLLLNSQNLALDKESVQINENKGKIFRLMQQLVKQINKEESLGMKIEVENEIQIIDVINDLSAQGKGQYTRVTKTTTPIERKQAGEASMKSQEELNLEKEILELSTSYLTITQKILKIIKITTMLKQQLTILTQYQFSIKQQIQKLTTEQFSVKMQLGIAKVEWDIYAEKIRKLRVEYEKWKQKKNFKKMNELAVKINTAVKQLEVPKGKAWDLTAQHESLQQKIDEYLVKLNSITEKIIIFKKQLVYYEQQQRKLEEMQLKIDREKNEKKKFEQIRIKQMLETEKSETETLKKEIITKKQEREIACTKPKKTSIKKDNSWLEFDYGWSKFIKIRIEATKKGQYVQSTKSKKESYAKGAFDDGVFRIRQKLNEILLYEIQREQTVGGTLFKRIKVQVDNYVKVLMKQESILQKNEMVIQQRILKVAEEEIKVKKKAQTITDDLNKCKLEFPKIKKEAEKIRGKDVTQTMLKDIKKMEEQLRIIRDKNIEEEKKLEKRQKEVQLKIKEIELRKKKIEELKKLHLKKTEKIIEKEKTPITIPVTNKKITNSDVVITKSKTQQQEYTLKLESQEQDLDKYIKELESKSDKHEDLSDSLDDETTAIESNLQKLIIEEEKIMNEKKTLVIQRENIEQEIVKCKVDFKKGTKLITLKQKEFQQLCLLNRDKFREEKSQLDHDINAYDELYHELQEEKNQYQLYQKKLIGFKKPTANKKKQQLSPKMKILLQKSIAVVNKASSEEFVTLLSEIKNNVQKEALFKNIHNALNVVNQLAENNAKQARMLDEQIGKLNDQDKLALLKSMKIVQTFTQKITSKLNLILSEYPEDQVKLKSIMSKTASEIDQLYDLTKKQSNIMSFAKFFTKKEKKLLKMKDKCIIEERNQKLQAQQKHKKGFLAR